MTSATGESTDTQSSMEYHKLLVSMKSDPNKVELLQVERRFPDSFRQQAGKDGATEIDLCFSPSDPQFRFSLPAWRAPGQSAPTGDDSKRNRDKRIGLLLRICLPADYPTSPCLLTVQHGDEEVPRGVRDVIRDAVVKFVEPLRGQQMLRKLFHFLDRHFEQLIEVGLKREQRYKDELAELARKSKAASKTLSAAGDEKTASTVAVATAATVPQPAEVASSSQPSTSASNVPQAATPNAVAAAVDDAWTPQQQDAFEAALKQFPTSLGLSANERWDRIAALVPGKTRKQCVKRFQDLRDLLRAQAESAGAASQPVASSNGSGNTNGHGNAADSKSASAPVKAAAPKKPDSATPAKSQVVAGRPAVARPASAAAKQQKSPASKPQASPAVTVPAVSASAGAGAGAATETAREDVDPDWLWQQEMRQAELRNDIDTALAKTRAERLQAKALKEKQLADFRDRADRKAGDKDKDASEAFDEIDDDDRDGDDDDDEGDFEGDGDDNDNEGDASGDEGFDAGDGKIALNPAHRGTQIKLVGLTLTGIPLLKAANLSLQLTCTRCRTAVDVSLSPGQAHADTCSSCHQAFAIHFRAEMVHQHSASLGYVDVSGCVCADLLPSDFLASCFECLTEAPLKALQRGKVCLMSLVLHACSKHWLICQRVEDSCRKCHAKLGLQFDNVEFVAVVAPSAGANAKAGGNKNAGSRPKSNDAERGLGALTKSAKRAMKKEQQGLRLGSPLPNKGACKHYKHSYRWLRFPCCGKAFPCDSCHAENSDHEMKWATRMICGHCSKEQPFSNKLCIQCSASFSGGSKSHWEGGSGCRNKSTMNRKDTKKHAGLGKTKSRRAVRLAEKKAKG